MGDVPAAGRWATLRIPAKEIGLEGRRLDGIGFAVDGGHAFWGKTVLVTASGKEIVLIDGSLEALRPKTGEWRVRFTVPDSRNLRVRSLFENVSLRAEGNGFEDRFPVPYRARVYEITP
jgi:hypothetical protein